MGEIEKNLLNLIIKEKKLILIGLISGLVIFLIYYLFFYTPLYVTTSKLYIKNIVKPNVIAQYPDAGTIKSESGYSNPLFNLYEQLKSENISNKVFAKVQEKYPKDLGEFGVTSKEEFYLVYLGIINSKVIPSTDVLSVELKWPNKKNAPDVLVIIIDEFKKESLDIRRSLDTQKRIFLEDQTDVISEELAKIRENIKTYKIENRMSESEIEAENLANIRLNIIREVSLLKAQEEFSKIMEIDNSFVTLNAASGVGGDPYLTKLSQDLAFAHQRLAALKTKFTDKYDQVVEVKGEIDEIKRKIEQRTGEMQKTLEKAIEEILKREKEIHTKKLGLENLEKQEDAFATAYQSIKSKQLEAKIKENEIVDNIIVLKSPSRAIPFFLTIITRFLGFIMFGAFAGLGIAYIKQALEDKWADLDELKRITGQEILGVVPWLNDEYADNAYKIYDAAYTNIASDIITKASSKDTSIVGFISTNIYHNKSVITGNVAKLLTSLEKTSVIIDFSQNFENKPDLTDLINLLHQKLKQEKPEESEELENLLKSSLIPEEIIIDEKVSRVFYLGINNNNNPNLKYYVSTKAFSVLLNYLKMKFDFVLINMPHGNFMLPENQFIIKNSESVAIIASMDSKRQELVKLINSISGSDKKILGIITRERNTDIEKYYNNLAEKELFEG